MNDSLDAAGLRMCKVVGTDWSGLMESGETLAAFLLRKRVPAYIRVRRELQTVYRQHRRPFGESTFQEGSSESAAAFIRRELVPAHIMVRRQLEAARSQNGEPSGDVGLLVTLAGFEDDALFLRLGTEELAEIAAGGSCFARRYSGDGFRLSRPHVITEAGPSGRVVIEVLPTDDLKLVRFEFEHALIIDKRHRADFMAASPPINPPAVELSAITLECHESDLYLTASDVDALVSGARHAQALVPYPFDHAERMPGLYATFQAAYGLNRAKAWPVFDEKKLAEWIKREARRPDMTVKCAKFAAKMARLSVDRTRGGSSEPLKIDELPHLVERPQDFTFEYVGAGLTLLLVVADWWMKIASDDPASTRLDLAKKLSELNFSPAETGEAVQLITGASLTKAEHESFLAFAKKRQHVAAIRLAKDKAPGL